MDQNKTPSSSTGSATSSTTPKKLPPYWAELGYERDPQTGLFHRQYLKADGTTAHEVVLDAETFHRHRRENLTRVLMEKAK